VCGIAGFRTTRTDPAGPAQVLLDELSLRGPDGGWWEQAEGWCLVQTRLAVFDLSDQVRYPMTNEDGSVLLLFNGEVYNHLDLRAELLGLGHVFATHCDAEVVVHGYEQWGTGVLSRLNAMFALAILDRRTGELLLARDERGIKPLVRTTRGPVAFGSDALALVAAGLVDGTVDQAAIAQYLAFHYVPEPRTGLADVESVLPGTAVRIAADGTETVLRWSGPVFDRPEDRRPVSFEEADEVLRRAVERQLQADVEVGVFLSGGVDSALVLDYAVELGARPKAFTIGFAGTGDYDESEAAAAVARRLGVPHEVELLDVTFLDAVGELGRAYDIPLADESAIATLPLARMARRQVTVALSGTGGDDLFAGYYRHRAPAAARALRAVPRPLLSRLAAGSPDRGAERRNAVTLARSYAIRLARLAAGGARGHEQYLELVGSSTSPEVLDALLQSTDLAAARRAVGERLGLHAATLDDLQDFELRSYLPGCILLKEDRATMAHSLEARVPLLDDEVVALASRTPTSQRAGLRGGKVLLRQVAERRLPWKQGRKRGFAVPLRALFDGPWYDDAVSWLREGDSALVDGPAAAALVGRSDVSPLELWGVCALRAWEDQLGLARERGRRALAAA